MVGTSRHSAMVAARERVEVVRPFSVRAFALACGSTMIGAAVSLLVMADLGLPPYDVLSSGVAAHTGLTLGRSSWLLAGLLFLLASVLGRRPSAWGIAFILANGFAVDASADLLNAPASMPGRVLFLAAGILVMATGVSVVLYSGITGGPFELLMRAGEDRGVSATTVRYGLDLAVLVVGIIIGGAFGIGTMIFAALMGVVLQVLKRALLDHRTGRALRLNGSATSAS